MRPVLQMHWFHQSFSQPFLKGNNMIVERTFVNKPSFVSVNCAVRKAITDNATFIVLRWGENQINLEHTTYGWCGRGWIGKSGGQDIANKLNRS
jgi:hypothetical protein